MKSMKSRYIAKDGVIMVKLFNGNLESVIVPWEYDPCDADMIAETFNKIRENGYQWGMRDYCNDISAAVEYLGGKS